MINHKEKIWFMRMALEEADAAYRVDEVPIGCVIVGENGEMLSKTHNLKESVNDPCGHAEILAIREASERTKNWRLVNSTLFVTLEPCPMCLGAMIQARISNLVFGAYDKKGGAISLGYKIYKDDRLNHNFSVIGGIEHYKCAKVLSRFFKEKRDYYKKIKK